MQTLGTEWGRGWIHEDLWVELWRKHVGYHLSIGGKVVVDDSRFPNEAKAVHALGGKLIRIRREGLQTGTHVSELHALPWDASIMNEG
jgi:hypothetical protein